VRPEEQLEQRQLLVNAVNRTSWRLPEKNCSRQASPLSAHGDFQERCCSLAAFQAACVSGSPL
jgi:hypothetical protein